MKNFLCLKDILKPAKLEAQGKLFEGQSKIQRSASEFKFSNRKQFEVNAKLESLFSARIKASADNPSQINTYNLGQNCWENSILGQHFPKHRSCTGCSLSPSPESNVVVYSKESLIPGRLWEATLNWGKGFSFLKGVVLEIFLLRRKVDMMGETFSSSFVWDCRYRKLSRLFARGRN